MAQPLTADQLTLLATLQGGALPDVAAAACAGAGAAAGAAAGVPSPAQQTTPGGGSSYRLRAPTNFRGVTRTSGTASGVQKFDVQFVFCDNGLKKHPKIYGFATMDAAARAFDLLTLKRAMEKGRGVEAVTGAAINALGTNHPGKEYQHTQLLAFLEASSRDDLIYGLKQCAKKGLTLPSGPSLLAELQEGVEAARGEAAEKQRIGDPRQSYEVTAKTPTDRKRKAPSSSSLAGSRVGTATGPPAPAAVPPSADSMLAAAAAAVALGQQAAQAQAAQQAQQAQQVAAAALMLHAQQAAAAATDAVTLKAEDIVGGHVRNATPVGTPTGTPRATKAAAAGGAAPGAAGMPGAPAAMDADASGAGAAEEGSGEGEAAPTDATASADGEEGAAGEAAGPRLAAAAQAAAPAAPAAQPGTAPAFALGGATQQSANLSGLPAAAMQALAQPAQPAAHEQLLLAQLLQGQLGGGAQHAQHTQHAVSGRLASQGLPLLLELLRLGAGGSQDMGAAHDIVRIWAAVHQGQPWPADQQTHLPQHYYQGLLAVLQACPDVASILALTSQLWQSGMLGMLCTAYASSLQQQAAAAAAAGPLGALLGALGGGQPTTGLGQLASLLGGAAGGAPAAPAGGGTAALAALLQGPGAAQSLLGALGGGAGQLPPQLAAQLGPLLAASGPQAAALPAALLSAGPAALARPPAPNCLAATIAAGAAADASGQPTSPPPSKRGKLEGGEGSAGEGAAQAAAMPLQMQQLLSLLGGEHGAAGDPALAAQAQREAQHAAAEAATAQQQDGTSEQPQQAVAKEQPAGQAPAVATGEAAEAQQLSAGDAAAVAAEAEDALATAAAAAALSVQQQPQQHQTGVAAPALQHTPTGKAPPGRQASLLIVQAQPQGPSHQPSDGLGTPSGRPPTSPTHGHTRRGSGGAGAAPAGGFAARGATVTTGLHRSGSSGAPPVTTGGSLGSAGSPPPHASFGGAGSVACQVPGRVGKSGLPQVMRCESYPPATSGGAQVTTGIPSLARPQVARLGVEAPADGASQLAALRKQGSASTTGSGSTTTDGKPSKASR